MSNVIPLHEASRLKNEVAVGQRFLMEVEVVDNLPDEENLCAYVGMEDGHANIIFDHAFVVNSFRRVS